MLSLHADVLWGSWVRPWGRNECVTNEPQRTSAGRLGDAWSIHVFFPKTKQIANPKSNLHLYFFAAEVKMLNEIKQT